MRKIIARVQKSEFILSTATVFSGSLISQLIPIFSAPFLARIYTPANYGTLAIYLVVSSLIGVASTFQYHNAILLPKQNEDAFSLVQLCIRNSILSGLACMVLMLFIGKPLMHLINADNVVEWLYLIPFSVFFIGVNVTLTTFATRNKLFKLVSLNRIIAALVSVTTSITLGLYYKNESGLILGLILGQFVNGIILGVRIAFKLKIDLKSFFVFKGFSIIVKKYLDFPKYSMPTDLLNNFTNQIPVLMMNTFSGPYSTGLFNMCNRLLSLPQTFISGSFADVFRQRASYDYNHTGSFRNIFVKMAKTLTLLSIIPFIIILLFGPDLFSIYLGEQWREAGQFARIMAPIFVLSFINSPLSYVYYLVGKLKFDLIMTIYLNISTIILFLLTLSYGSLYLALVCYVINYSCTYLFMLFKSFQFSKLINPEHEHI